MSNLKPRVKSASWRYGILAIAGIVIGFVVVNAVLTQVIAARLGHHSALGSPLIGELYHPFAWWSWQYQFRYTAKGLFGIAYIAHVVLVAGVLLTAVIVRARNRRPVGYDDLHGTAHWATRQEIDRMAVIEGKGVYIGGWEEEV